MMLRLADFFLFLLRPALFVQALCLASLATAQSATGQDCPLSNGMQVIVKEDHRAPTVAHMVWYKVGSMDEQNGTTGVAHVLEHMMFKGTKQLKPGEFSARVAALGGRDNAFTSKDYTAYFQQIEKSRLEDVMKLEADRMANLQFSKEEFSREIQVVMEERRWRTEDQPIPLLYEGLFATAFFSHPYHHPIVGWMSDLQNMRVADTRTWYERWYSPNNATLVVAGDVDPDQVCAMARKHFGKFKREPIVAARPQDEAPQRGERRITVKAPAENPYVAMAFKAPTLRDVEKDEDPFALEVLAGVLDGYDNARLNAQLVRTDRVANSVGASYSPIARGPVLFVLSGVPVSGTAPGELEQRLRAEVQEIAESGVSEAELKRVKTQLLAQEIFKRDSVFGQAMEIGMLEMSGIPYSKADRIVDRLEAVTARQVQDVAARYFSEDSMTVATLVPLPLPANKKKPPTALRH